LTHGVFAAAYLLRFPAWRASDEGAHFAYIQHLHLGLYYVTHHTRLAHRALDEFRFLIEKFPNTREAEEARFYLAVTHLALGQDSEARRWLNEVLRISHSATLKAQARKLLRFLDTEPPADLRRGDGE